MGLFLNPPINAVVLSADERSQAQALGRTAPMLPASRRDRPMTTRLIKRLTKAYSRVPRHFIDGWNDRCHSSVWIELPARSSDEVTPQRNGTSFSRHWRTRRGVH